MDGVHILNGNVLQHVLQGVKGGGQDELPAVAGKDGIIYLLKEDGGGRARGQRLGRLVYGEGEGDGELDDLVEEDGGRGEVTVMAGRGHDARVVHDLESQSQGQGQECYQSRRWETADVPILKPSFER